LNSDIYCDDVPNFYNSAEKILEHQTVYLQSRIKYCIKAIEYGLKEESYYALISSVKLYNLYKDAPGFIENPVFQNSLSNIITFAEMFINSGTAESELVQDAKGAIAYYSPMANLLIRKA
jgi:hypothetical protein